MTKDNRKMTAKERKQLFEEQIANRFLSVLTLEGARWVKGWKGPSIEESEEHLANHEAYVASWIKHIHEKPEALTNAIKEAQKACDYMTVLLDDSESPPDDESKEVLINVA